MSTPSAAWTALSEGVGGRRIHTLFALTVTHPTPHTWYLATVDLIPPLDAAFDAGTFDPGTFAVGSALYQGLVREHSGMAAESALGGLGGPGGVSLTLINALGTGGLGRRFMDTFVTPVPGYAEPYDLLTATLQVALLWPDLPDEPLPIGQALAIDPASFEWSVRPGEPESVTLTFGPDQRRYRTLPRTLITTRRYPHAPDASVGRPIVPWFGLDLRVPCVPLDADGGLYLIGASPAATPLGGVTRLWTVRPEPGADESEPVALPVALTTAGQVVLSIAGNTTALTLTQAAQRFELGPDGAFVYGVRLWLRRAVGGTPAVGSLSLAVVLDADGLPGESLVDRGAAAEINTAIVTTGSFAAYDIPFQSNNVGRAAFLPGRRGLWLVIKYAKTSGDLQLEVDATGAYETGILATRATGTDNEWILTGKRQRRGPVRQDFTGIGQLGRNVATGVIGPRPPVTVPGF